MHSLPIKLSLALIAWFVPLSSHADDWPQWQGPQRDGIWRESGIVEKFPEGGPKVSWRTSVAGGYSGPAISQGKVFLTDYVRRAGDATPSPDKRNVLEGTERLLCLDEATGKLIWKYDYERPYAIAYPAGPRATPLVDDGHVYMLGSEGDLACLIAENGELVWKKNLSESYQTKSPIWGYAAHPLIHDNMLYTLAGGKGSAVVALDKTTGVEIWRALSTPDIGYAPPTLINAGGTLQLLIWHSKSLNSLDPSTGKVFWTVDLEPDYGMSIAPPLHTGDWLYVGAIKDKSMALKLSKDSPTAKLAWKGSRKLGVGPSHCPIVADPRHPDYVYGVDRGSLRCVKLSTGERVWETFALMENKKRWSNAGTIFITPQAERFFLFSETGELAIAKLSPDGYEEIDRTTPLLAATHDAFGRDVLWSAPAYANQAMFVRNDKELIRVSLGKE